MIDQVCVQISNEVVKEGNQFIITRKHVNCTCTCTVHVHVHVHVHVINY